MAIPLYLWFDEKEGKLLKGSVDVTGPKGSIELIGMQHNLFIPTDDATGTVRGMGPGPRGTWKIGSIGTGKGPLTITLNHISGNSYARDMTTFRIHGDKRDGIRGFASAGCIIMGPSTRLLVSKDRGALLEVVR